MFRWLAGFISSRFGGLRLIAGSQSSDPSSRAVELPACVNFDTAMAVSAFWASARLISETVGSTPSSMHKADDPAVALPNHAVAKLLKNPHPRYTEQEFMEFRALCLAVHGNAYAVKHFNGAGDVIQLEPLMPAQVEVRLLNDGTRIFVHYDQVNGVTRVYADESIWHSRLFGNGLIGLSPLAHAANSLGIAIASENRVAATMLNGAKPSGILMIDKILTEPQRDQIRASFKTLAEGNKDSLVVLEAGMKYEAVSMTPQDIELLESRRFSAEDIARFMGVPSVLINDTGASTVWGSGIESIIRGWYTLGLRPYFVRIAQTGQKALLKPGENAAIHFDMDELLAGDPKARAEIAQSKIQSGALTINESRRLDRRPPVKGGDTTLVNSTLTPLDRAINPPEPKFPTNPAAGSKPEKP